MPSTELDRALESEHEPRILVDDQLRVVAVNDAYLKRLDLTREEVLGRPLRELPSYSGAVRAELERMNEHLRVALSGAKALSWEWDLSSGQGIFSDNFAAFYGITDRDLEKLGWQAIIHPDDRERMRNERPEMEPEKDWVVEFRGVERPGGARWYAVRGKVLSRADGKGLRLVGVTWDITEQKRLLSERSMLEQRIQEAQRLESLGVLAGGIAHDFNNILLAILGNANLARVSLETRQNVTNYLEHIEDAACRAADLCKQLLAYAGRGHFILAPTDLNQIVHDTVHLLKVSIDRRVALRLDLAPSLPSVVADVTQLRQVLMNLVINASDATGDRGGSIVVSTGVIRADKRFLENTRLTSELTPGEYVYLEVADNGVGMSPETLGRIFEPFFTTKFTGRGLGLSAVLGIVKGHKGALQVSSQSGVGSRFTLLLPAVDEPPSKTHSVPKSLAQLGSGETVMVVDDEEAVRSVTAHMLKALGFTPLIASNGSEALALHETQGQHVACVIMDLTMPNPSGHEVYQILRERSPQLKVLLMSGYAEEETNLGELPAHLTMFLQKPFKMDDLREALRTLLFKPKRAPKPK